MIEGVACCGGFAFVTRRPLRCVRFRLTSGHLQMPQPFNNPAALNAFIGDNVGFLPGQLNLWLGWRLKPAPGGCSLVGKHMQRVISDGVNAAT